jgi:hypothetical protein
MYISCWCSHNPLTEVPSVTPALVVHTNSIETSAATVDLMKEWYNMNLKTLATVSPFVLLYLSLYLSTVSNFCSNFI